MFCSQCGKRSPRGSRYCRHCGTSLAIVSPARVSEPEESRVVTPPQTDRRPQLQTILDRAFFFSEKGDVLSAILACEQAVALDPSNATAHSFLGLLYERSGQVDKALYEYERAVELNPNSSLDRDSLQRLKEGVNRSRPARKVRSIRRSSPYFETTPVVVAAFLAIILLLTVHRYVNGRASASEGSGNVRVARAIAPVGGTPLMTMPQPLRYRTTPIIPLQNQPAPLTQQSQSNEQTGNPSAQSPANGNPQRQGLPPTQGGRWVSVPLKPGAGTNPANQPMRSGFNPAPQSQTPSQPDTQNRGAPTSGIRGSIARATPGDNSQPNTGMPANPQVMPQMGPRGYIRVTVGKAGEGSRQSSSDSSNTTATSSQPPTTSSASSSGSNHERTANRLFLQGDVDGAIENYKRAVDTSTIDTEGMIRQQLANAYIRKKQTGEALAEYRRAYDAYKRQSEAGVNRAMAEKGMRACQNAINTWEPAVR